MLSFITANAHNNEELEINTAVSKVEWVGKKVAGKHNGQVTIKEGVIHLHDGKLSKAKVVIDMESITVEDLQGEWKEKLTDHLKSADFFDVENHKTATLEITKIEQKEKNNYLYNGNLSIKGITKPISFEAKTEMQDNKIAAYATIKIDRTLYDIKYGSGKFFEGLGDKMIDDEFTIKFKIAAE